MPLVSDQGRRKRNLIIICGFLVLLVVATAFEFGIRTPNIPVASTIVVFALFNLNLIVFLLLLVLLFRNLVKLSFERRQKVIGSKFKAKLVLAFLSLSLAPAILIFIIASNFINTSIEGWFKPQVEQPLDQALSVAQTYYQNLEATALRHGQHLARTIARDGLLGEDRRETLAADWAGDRVEDVVDDHAAQAGRRPTAVVHAREVEVPQEEQGSEPVDEDDGADGPPGLTEAPAELLHGEDARRDPEFRPEGGEEVADHPEERDLEERRREHDLEDRHVREREEEWDREQGPADDHLVVRGETLERGEVRHRDRLRR